jgi:serine protease inhibitor
MKKLFLFLIPLALMGCSDNDGFNKPTIDWPTIPFRPGMYNFVKTSNLFGDKMMLELCTDENNKNQNVTFSPYSMNILLSMIANGASDDPQKEMLKVMGMEKYGIDSLNIYNKDLLTTIKAYTGTDNLKLANATWIQNGLTVKDSFTNTMKDIYSSDVMDIDFNQTEAAQNTINDWCNDNTNGMIKKTSLEVTPDMKAVLANATYLKCEWEQKFDKSLTHKAEFTNQSGTKSEVDMMITEKNFPYIKNKDYDLVILTTTNNNNISYPQTKDSELTDYIGSFMHVILVLPAEGVDIDSLIGKVNLDESPSVINAKLTMPKFKIENHWKEFNNTLRNLGINKVMNTGDNMNRITRDLFVSNIVQDVAINVNEYGAEAAAVSAGGICTTSIPDEKTTINFNRPFLFYIKENITGAILFMGKIANL